MDNPFLKPITPASETVVDENAKLFEAVGGKDLAEEYLSLVADEQRPTRQKPTDIQDLAKRARAQQEELLGAIAEKRVKEFFDGGLVRQFKQQIKSLTEIDFLETDDDGQLNILGEDGQRYRAPTEAQVVAYFNAPERRAFYEKKVKQGFTRVLVTPFGTSMSQLAEKTRPELLKYANYVDSGALQTLLDRNGAPLSVGEYVWVSLLDELDPRDGDENGVVYDAELINGHKLSPGRKKVDIIRDKREPFPGFRIQLLQDDLTILRGIGETSSFGRPAIETGKTPFEYMQLLQENPAYEGEHGLTPEDWLTLFMTHLHETDQVIDDCANGVDSGCYLIACSLQWNLRLPAAFWRRETGVEIGGLDFTVPHDDYGIRVGVR
ncbi:MAG: hypothetical protein NT003_04520 [Candidatus Magasanikbacteria bacterium]|nr:hypothetical protein [Candidatus Magasanikbacteria bacterium]